jgi:tRNA-dihydrouridine synthase
MAVMKPVIILAPIRGVTDRIFRNVFAGYFPGFDFALAPFIATSRQRSLDRKILREFQNDNQQGMPAIPQILSNNVDDFIQLANALYDAGHERVNWNLGCPFPMVANKRKGSGLLCYPDLIEEFLERVVPAIKATLSVKMRLGFEYPDEIERLIPILNRYPIEEITIHPRTGRQLYSGKVDLDMFEQSLRQIKHEVVYNGDLVTQQQFFELSARFPSVNKWMIGRGAIMNPFLPSMIKGDDGISSHERNIAVNKFHDHLFEEYTAVLFSPSHVMDRMKGIWFYLEKFFPEGRKIFKKIKKTQSPEHYLDEVQRAFSGL